MTTTVYINGERIVDFNGTLPESQIREVLKQNGFPEIDNYSCTINEENNVVKVMFYKAGKTLG